MALSLAEILRDAIDGRLADVHTALPGRVLTYDPVGQTAEVQLMVRGSIGLDDGSQQSEELPVLPNVPVGWFASGGFWLQFPINPGDSGWVMFSEASWSHYRETGELGDPGDLRKHDLSYGVFLPIVRPNAGALPALSAGEAALGVPDGMALRVGGPSADFVALAAKVDAEFTKVKSAIAAVNGGLTTPITPPPYSSPASSPAGPESVASTKLKSE